MLWGACLYTILKLMMMSTLDLSNWLVFLFLPWYMRKSAVSMHATLKTSTWVPILNKTLPRNHLRVWQALRNLCHLLQSPLTPVRLQPLDAVARAQYPAFQTTVFKCTVHPLSRRQSNEMEAPEFRQDILKHYNAFKAVARECWQTFILWYRL